MRSRRWLWSAVVASSVAVMLSAQEPSVARLVQTEGAVRLNDESVEMSAVPMVLPDPVVVRTSQSRATVELKRGGWLFVDVGSSVRVLGNSPYNFNRLQVLEGRAIVMSETSAPTVDCTGSVRLSSRGVFRFVQLPVNEWGEQACQSRVYEGAAAVPLSSLTVALRPGQSIMCGEKCTDMRPVNEFSTSRLDEFDQWARQAYEQLDVTPR